MPHNTTRPTALVTGASAGLGVIFARRLAAMGYDLVLVARRKERLEELAARLSTEYGICAEALPADLTSDTERKVVEERIRKDENFAFLVNNAGFGRMSLFTEDTVDGFDAMVRLHVLATTRLTHATLPGMIARRKGFIINVSSVAAFIQGPSGLLYCATKAWMNSFTEGIRLLTHGTGVRVQALCPGFTRTEFHDVMGMDRALVADSWWLDAEDVVDLSLKSLKKDKLFVVTGLRYKLIRLLWAVMPRCITNRIALRHHRKRMRLIIDE